MAGGATVPTTAAAEYNPTMYAKQGDLGSIVLKPRPSGTVWKRGTVALARQQSTAAHGGGYIYRLCPANETLSEECFNRMPLEFAFPNKHTLRFADPKLDREINATLVTEGGGKGWMIYPWPSPGDGDCMCAFPYHVRIFRKSHAALILLQTRSRKVITASTPMERAITAPRPLLSKATRTARAAAHRITAPMAPALVSYPTQLFQSEATLVR